MQKYNRDSKIHLAKCATETLKIGEHKYYMHQGKRFTLDLQEEGKDILHMKLKIRPGTV